MAGNRLGGKIQVIYYTDNVGVAYILNRDVDLVFAGLGEAAASPELYDPANPPAGVIIGPAPRRFNPRVLFIESPTDGARKELIAFHPNSDLYKQTFRQTMPSIDGDATFVSTGRKGEKISF
mgnify:FL=1